MANLQEFYASFQAARTAIESRLDTFNQIQPSPDQIAQIAQDVQIERKKLNKATLSLPSYDRRSYESQLQQLEARINVLRSKGAPSKGTFAFKKKVFSDAHPKPTQSSTQQEDVKSTSNQAQAQASRSRVSVSGPTTSSSSSSIPNLQISCSSYRCFTLSSLPQSVSSSSTDLTINSLDHCIVDLIYRDPSSSSADSETDGIQEDNPLKLTAAHVRDIKDSVLLLGHITGSILVHNLERCVIVAACRQLRVHTSRDIRFHLHVSNGIIEDCTSLTFGPYPETLPLPSEILQQRSTHAAIQDFSHLKAAPSPNWSVAPSVDCAASPGFPPSSNLFSDVWNEIRALIASEPRDHAAPPDREAEADTSTNDLTETRTRARIESILATVLPLRTPAVQKPASSR